MSPTGASSTATPSHQPAGPGTERNQTAARLRVVTARLARRLRNQNAGGLTASQLSALAAIEAQPGIRIGQLAALEGIAASSMTRIVAGLSDAGLLDRHPDPVDGRSARVSLSAMGRHTLAQVRQDRTMLLLARIHQLHPDDYARLAAAVPVLESLLDGEC